MSKQQIQKGRNWYAIHTYSGYENTVMRNLKQRIESLGMEDKIFNVLVPTEKKIKEAKEKRDQNRDNHNHDRKNSGLSFSWPTYMA